MDLKNMEKEIILPEYIKKVFKISRKKYPNHIYRSHSSFFLLSKYNMFSGSVFRLNNNIIYCT